MRRFLGPLLLLAVTLPAAAKTKSSGTWTDPEVKAATYTKVVVYAKLQDMAVRRVFEDTAVSALKERGCGAVPAYEVIVPEDLANRETIVAKLKALGADAALVFVVEEQGVVSKPRPTVSIGIGVMAGSGPVGIGVGGSVPVGGGGNSTYMIFGIRSEFHAMGVDGPRWIGNYTTDLQRGGATAASEVADLTVKNMKKARVLK